MLASRLQAKMFLTGINDSEPDINSESFQGKIKSKCTQESKINSSVGLEK